MPRGIRRFPQGWLVPDPSPCRFAPILINIFGGIVRCDLIAEGIISAVKEVGIDIPVIVRLEGTNVEKGRQMLDDSQLAITSASDLNDGAKKAVAAVA